MRATSVRVVTAITCLLFGAAAWRVGSHVSSGFIAQAQTDKNGAMTAATIKPAVASVAATLKPVSSSVPNKSSIPEPKPIAAPGTEIYTAKRGEAIPTIAHRYLARTSYLTSSELADAIRAANHKSDTSNILKANENIIIPGILSAPIVAKTVPVPRDFEVRAIYLTGMMAGSDHGLRTIRHWREVGGNAVVFDIKDSDGSVSIPFDYPLVGKHNIYIHDLPKLLHFLHQENMHATARIAIFRDERLVADHPELAVQSRSTHQAWRENGKLVWTDPSQPKVQDYNIALAKYVAQQGADEIQFDYVRFPAEGDQKDAAFVFQNEKPEPAPAADAGADNNSCGDGRLARPAEASANAASNSSTDATQNSATAPAPQGQKNAAHGASRGTNAKNGTKSRRDGTNSAKATACHAPRGPQRADVIAAFLKKAYAEIHPTGALFSLDVFGVMAWQRQVDLSHTGQDIVQMAKYCDVLSPMIYPSHFFGMDNIPHPGDEPAHFIGESMDRFELVTKGSGVVIRPWLQAFHWRTKTYSPEYIKVQVETARAKGGIGFLFWNAGNDYSKPFTAMPEMKAANYTPAPKDAAPASPTDASKDGANGGAKDNPKYFRGDELPIATTQAALTPTK
ncbi:MAG: putative glycoside hydrolase [Candidatus Sulfotelmatobacter sp.]